MRGEELAITIVFPILFFTFGWIVWAVVDGRRRWMTVKARAELYNRMMDKFGSAREFIEFSQTEGGQRFLETFSTERVVGRGPMERILGSIQKGAILSIVGIGSLLLGWRYGDELWLFPIIGTLVLALGVGFLVSAGISYRLSKQWGLFARVESSKQSELVSRP